MHIQCLSKHMCFLERTDLLLTCERSYAKFSAMLFLLLLSLKLFTCQVSATRRGLKNQLKNLWWRKGKEETADVQAGAQWVSLQTSERYFIWWLLCGFSRFQIWHYWINHLRNYLKSVHYSYWNVIMTWKHLQLRLPFLICYVLLIQIHV